MSARAPGIFPVTTIVRYMTAAQARQAKPRRGCINNWDSMADIGRGKVEKRSPYHVVCRDARAGRGRRAEGAAMHRGSAQVEFFPGAGVPVCGTSAKVGTASDRERGHPVGVMGVEA